MNTKHAAAQHWWPVRYPGAPGADDGLTPAFEVSFLPKTREQMAALMRRAIERKLTNAELVQEAVEGWRGKLSLGAMPGSAPVPFSAVSLRLACLIEPCFVGGVMRALMERAASLDPLRGRRIGRALAGVPVAEKADGQPR